MIQGCRVCSKWLPLKSAQLQDNFRNTASRCTCHWPTAAASINRWWISSQALTIDSLFNISDLCPVNDDSFMHGSFLNASPSSDFSLASEVSLALRSLKTSSCSCSIFSLFLCSLDNLVKSIILRCFRDCPTLAWKLYNFFFLTKCPF